MPQVDVLSVSADTAKGLLDQYAKTLDNKGKDEGAYDTARGRFKGETKGFMAWLRKEQKKAERELKKATSVTAPPVGEEPHPLPERGDGPVLEPATGPVPEGVELVP